MARCSDETLSHDLFDGCAVLSVTKTIRMCVSIRLAALHPSSTVASFCAVCCVFVCGAFSVFFF